MEIVHKKIIVNGVSDVISIYFLGDIHEGNANSNAKALKRAIKMIEENDNAYWIGMGDYIDCIVNSQDPRFDPVEISSKYRIRDLKNLPKKQMQEVIKAVSPIKDKCIALLVGNHEEQYIKRHSFDVYDYLATEIGAPKLGYVGDVLISIATKYASVGLLRIALNHGDGGGGRNEGYPLSKTYQVFKYRIADVNVMGHIHRLAVGKSEFIKANNTGTGYKNITRWYGCSGCFLDTYTKGNRNYYEHKGGPASDIGMLRLDIRIDGNKKIVYSLNAVYLDK